MARKKLHNRSQPIPVRALLWLYELFASLKLAVLLIFGLATVLAFATFIESNLGTAAARFYIYHTQWFSILLSFLALSIFCAAAIRYPWKRHQTGFVITHVGLLTLLAGSAISYRGSVNSQLLVMLGESSRNAIDNDEGYLYFQNLPGRTEPLGIRFSPGPFNWADLKPGNASRRLKSLFGADDLSKEWTHPPQLVHEHEGTRVEISDFYSSSEIRELPFLDLKFNHPAMGLDMPAIEIEYNDRLSFGESDFAGLGSIMFWRTNDVERWQAFQECIPDRTVADDGALAIWSRGETFHLSIRELKKLKEAGTPFDLEDGRTVELTGYALSADVGQLMNGKGIVSRGQEAQKMPAVEILVREKTGDTEKTYRMFRFALLPFLPNRDEPKQFLVEFYHPQIKGRVDILQGPEGKLAYRVWQQKIGRVVAKGELKVNEPVGTWSTGGTPSAGAPTQSLQPAGEWMMTLNRYVTRKSEDEPVRVLPLGFTKDNRGDSKRVQVRISWTDQETKKPKHEEFWLRQNLPEPWLSESQRLIRKTKISDDVTIHCEYRVRETDVGFSVKLVDFDLDVDPGTSMAANYTSHIIRIDVRDLPDVKQLREKMETESDAVKKQSLREELQAKMSALIAERVENLEDVSPTDQTRHIESDEALTAHVITMNEPFDYPDLQGRHLRFFQENYLQPDKSRGTPLGSIFRVNYDPGRPVKYLGSLLITVGIYLMFYMRAYFFKTIEKRPVDKKQLTAETDPSSVKKTTAHV